MKNKFIKILPIYIFIILFGIRTEALTVTTTVSELPTSTEKNNYITLKHTFDENADNISIEYSYDNKYLQLVGFVPTSVASCTLEKDTILCSNVSANTTFVYPVFKIIANFNTNKDISATFNTTEAHNTTKTTITKVDKKIDVTAIQLDSEGESLIVDNTYQIVATVLPENATNKTITYTSSNEEIATVTDTGLVKAISAGTATITVSSGNIKSIFTVNITEEEVPLESITVVESIDMKIGESKDLEVTFEPEDTTIDTSEIIYSSSDSKVAIVDANGKVVAISSGTATITVSLGDQTTSTKITVAEEVVKEEKQSNSSFVPCLITALITFCVTLLLVFIKNTIKRKKELNNDDDDDDFKLNSYE